MSIFYRGVNSTRPDDRFATKRTKRKNKNPWSRNYAPDEDTVNNSPQPQDYSQGYINPYVQTPNKPVFDTPSVQENAGNLQDFMNSNNPPQFQNRWKKQPSTFTFSQLSDREKCGCEPKKEASEIDYDNIGKVPYRYGKAFHGEKSVVYKKNERPIWERVVAEKMGSNLWQQSKIAENPATNLVYVIQEKQKMIPPCKKEAGCTTTSYIKNKSDKVTFAFIIADSMYDVEKECRKLIKEGNLSKELNLVIGVSHGHGTANNDGSFKVCYGDNVDGLEYHYGESVYPKQLEAFNKLPIPKDEEAYETQYDIILTDWGMEYESTIKFMHRNDRPISHIQFRELTSLRKIFRYVKKDGAYLAIHCAAVNGEEGNRTLNALGKLNTDITIYGSTVNCNMYMDANGFMTFLSQRDFRFEDEKPGEDVNKLKEENKTSNWKRLLKGEIEDNFRLEITLDGKLIADKYVPIQK